MKKITYLIKTYTKHPENYGIMWEPREGDAFEAMLALPKGSRYIKHFWRREWIEKPEYGLFRYKDDADYLIKQGDLTYYIDVFYENEISDEKMA